MTTWLAGMFLALLLPATALANPAIQHWTTSGARVYFVEAHELPVVDVQVVFAAGSARDPADRHGLASLTTGLLDEGAGGMHANDIAFEFERLGAIYNADTNYDSTSVSLRSLSEKKMLAAALETFKRVIAAPDFPDDAIERQRNRTLIGIQHKEQSPGALAADALRTAIYGEHPYGHPREGTAESVNRITREDIVEFHHRFFVARNAVIAIVGDLSRARADSLARELAHAIGEGEPAPPVPAVPALKAASEEHIAHPSQQMHILAGQPGMKQGDADYFPLYVGNHVLGGSGLVSRLFKEIREERGLSYSASSSFSARRELGPFVAGLQTRADQAGEALAVLRASINEFIATGPTPEELVASKRNITGGFPLRLDSNREILGYTAMIGYYGLPLDWLETFNDHVQDVTVDDVKDAFGRRLHPDRMATVLVGPAEGAEAQ